MMLRFGNLHNEIIRMLQKFGHCANVLVVIRRDLLLVKDSVS